MPIPDASILTENLDISTLSRKVSCYSMNSFSIVGLHLRAERTSFTCIESSVFDITVKGLQIGQT